MRLASLAVCLWGCVTAHRVVVTVGWESKSSRPVNVEGASPAPLRGLQVAGDTDFTGKQGVSQRRDRWFQSLVIYFYN